MDDDLAQMSACVPQSEVSARSAVRPMETDVPIAVVSFVLTPATLDDRQRLAHGLDALKAEDVTFEAGADPATGQVTIGAGSERHLEILADRLARHYSVRASVSRPHVIYRPALSRIADGEAKHARQTSEGGEYGHVVIRLSPRAPGTGYIFENRVQGGAVPVPFIPAVEQGIQGVLTREGFAGYPVADVRAELHDGSYHDIDSSAHAFRTAAAMATRHALLQAGPVLLEPIMRVDAIVPPVHVAQVVRHLVSSGGRVSGGQPEGNQVRVVALLRMSALFGYDTEFRSTTLGRGTCSITFAGYAPAPESDGEEGTPVGAPLRPAPHLKSSGIALPEPEEPGEH